MLTMGNYCKSSVQSSIYIVALTWTFNEWMFKVSNRKYLTDDSQKGIVNKFNYIVAVELVFF